LPHGVLFRGNTEADIRRNLIRQGVIKGIIGLPPNLFYGTGIPACIIVIDKAGAQAREGIFMVDASRGFMKDGNKNRLRARDIHQIVDVFNKQLTVPGYARLVPNSEIEANEYNLNIPRYIDSSEPEDEHDLGAHLHGGIPQRDIDAFDDYWQVFPSLRRTLFQPNHRPGYSDPLVAASQVKATILHHPEFQAFMARTMRLYAAWREAHTERLHNLAVGDDPKALIFALSEALLARFEGVALMDKYAIYQIIMDYWAETMQDDVYLITQDGYKVGNVLRELVVAKGERSKETPDLVIGRKKYKADLIPPDLVVARYFAAEQAEIERLQAEQDGLSQELEALVEEHSGEEGLLEEATNDKGKLTKTGLKARLKQLSADSNQLSVDEEAAEEVALLQQCQQLMDEAAEVDKVLKMAQQRLDEQVLARYPQLSRAEIQRLVIADKWGATLQGAIEAEIERVTQQLANRVQALAERYAQPLPQLVDEVAALSSKVEAHLQRMGQTW
jgi:type I restriction enzyme M protein